MAGEPWDPVERDRRYASAKRDGLTRLLTEGDSWFDYPPHPNIVDWLEAEGQWAIKRLEKSGDTVENMATNTNLSVLSRIAAKERPVCILLSGGGMFNVAASCLKSSGGFDVVYATVATPFGRSKARAAFVRGSRNKKSKLQVIASRIVTLGT